MKLQISLDVSSGEATLQFEIGSIDVLSNLERIFLGLADGRIKSTKLENHDFVLLCEPVCHFELRREEIKKEPSRTLTFKQIREGMAFEWVRHSDGWAETAELMNSLRRGGAYQFLCYGANNDIAIKAYMIDTPHRGC